ncbi:hypothetical protein SRHO_G00252210 [Serrasalmus rhombeus]
MRGLPGEMLSSSLAFLSGAGPGVLLVMVVIGSVGDVTVAAVLTYAILAIAMAALIYGFLVPMDSVVEKWRDISTGDVAQGLIGFIFKFCRHSVPSKQAAQHCSQLSGIYKTALITGLGVAVIPGDLGFVLTGLGVFITIKTAHLVLELQEQYKKFWKMMSHLGMKAIKRTWM